MVLIERNGIRFERLRSSGETVSPYALKQFMMRGATRIDIEKIVPTTRRIAVVVLKGADEGKAKRAIERLNRERDKLIFHEVNEPEEMPGDADLVVVFANGTTEGARRFLRRTGEKTATFLVREHEESSGEFDHEESLERISANFNRLLIGMSVAFRQRHDEFFAPLIPTDALPEPSRRSKLDN